MLAFRIAYHFKLYNLERRLIKKARKEMIIQQSVYPGLFINFNISIYGIRKYIIIYNVNVNVNKINK